MSEKPRLSWIASVLWFLVMGPIFSGFCIMVFAAISQGESNLINLAYLWFFSSAMIYALMSGIVFWSNLTIAATLLISIIFSALLYKAIANYTIFKYSNIYRSRMKFFLFSGCIGAFSTTASWLLATINEDIKLKAGITMIEVAPTGLLLGLFLGAIYFKKSSK